MRENESIIRYGAHMCIHIETPSGNFIRRCDSKVREIDFGHVVLMHNARVIVIPIPPAAYTTKLPVRFLDVPEMVSPDLDCTSNRSISLVVFPELPQRLHLLIPFRFNLLPFPVRL